MHILYICIYTHTQSQSHTDENKHIFQLNFFLIVFSQRLRDVCIHEYTYIHKFIYIHINTYIYI